MEPIVILLDQVLLVRVLQAIAPLLPVCLVPRQDIVLQEQVMEEEVVIQEQLMRPVLLQAQAQLYK
jgi:hypothetical protein